MSDQDPVQPPTPEAPKAEQSEQRRDGRPPYKRPFVKPHWEPETTFEAGEFAVEISKDTSRKPTKFSMRIGVRRADGTLNPNILVLKEEGITSSALARDYSGVLAELIGKAVAYIHEKIGWEWYQWVEHRIQREETKVGHGGPPQRVRSPGKTQRERDKRMRKPT